MADGNRLKIMHSQLVGKLKSDLNDRRYFCDLFKSDFLYLTKRDEQNRQKEQPANRQMGNKRV